MNETALQRVFDKFEGHCHFCGDEIDRDKRGWAQDLRRRWEADHVVMTTKGGSNNPDNFLPACTRCNRLRWGRSGSSLRLVLSIGLVAKAMAYHYQKSDLGETLRAMRVEKRGENWYRRQYLALAGRNLSERDRRRAVATLSRRRARFVHDLTEFEEHVYEKFRARHKKRGNGPKRGPKWNDVLAELSERYRKTGAHPAWLTAADTLGE
jgi:hypothetical protein